MRALRLLPWGSLLASVIMPASGSVVYTLTGVTAGFFDVPVSFAYTTPTFVTQRTPIPPDAFLLCANANCHDAVFTPHVNFGQGPGSILDAIDVQVSINGGGFEGGLFVFDPGAFANYGTYTSKALSFSPFTVAGRATLTVADSAVPEPGTGAAGLLALVVGFGRILHRRKILL
ncbi:MAG: hypothetical protein ACJ746_31410 [Bryobacteraceae bacterium]